MAREHQIRTCETCAGNGMKGGERCAVCNGQGFTRGTAAAAEPEEATPVNLKSLKKAELIKLAEERGLDTSGTVADLVERLMQPDPAPEAETEAGETAAESQA